MPLPSTVVFTGPIGPGNTLTTFNFTNVAGVFFDLGRAVIELTFTNTTNRKYLDINAISTCTVSIAASVATFTLS